MLSSCLVGFTALLILGASFVAPTDMTSLLCECTLEVILAVGVSIVTVALRKRSRGKRCGTKDSVYKLAKTTASTRPQQGGRGASICAVDSEAPARYGARIRSSTKIQEDAQSSGRAANVCEQAIVSSKPQALITAVRKGRLCDVQKLLDELYSSALKGQGKKAADEQMQDALSTVLRTCSASQKLQAALAIYDHVAGRVGSGHRDIWSLLLYVASESGAFDRCREFYQRLRALGLNPTGHDVVNAVRALSHSKNLTGVNSMFADLIISKCTYDGVVRNRCLTACCADNAFNLIPAIMESKVFADACDAAGYNTVMRAFTRRGQVSRCSELYDEMLQNGVTPTEVTLSVLVEVAVKAGNVARAWQLFDDFSVYGVAPNRVHYTTLLRGLVMAGEQTEVSKLLQLMETGPASLAPDLITYQSLVKAYADWGDVPSAVRALGQAVKRGLHPDDHMLNTVLYACAIAALKSDEVLRIFDELVGYGLTPSASSLALLLKALGSTKDWSSAVSMLTTMHQRFGISPEARFYAQLGLACLNADDFVTAKEVHNSMLQNTGVAALADSACAGLLHRCVHCPSLCEAKALAFQSQSCYIKKQPAANLSACTLLSCASLRLTQYIAENNLDARCESLLRTIPAQQAEWVMDQGFIISVDPSKGTASARVVGAVQRAKHVGNCWQFYPTEEVLARRFQEFVTLNALDADCISELEKLSNARKKWIMDQAFLVKTTGEERSASSAIMALCNDCPNLTNCVDLGALVEEFASVNKLDQRCVRTLKSLPCADVAHIIDQEGMHLSVDWSKGSSSGKVIGMISRLRGGNTDSRRV